MESSPSPDYLRYHEAAAIYRLSERTLRRLHASGELPVYKVGGSALLARADLDALFQRHRREAA